MELEGLCAKRTCGCNTKETYIDIIYINIYIYMYIQKNVFSKKISNKYMLCI